MSADQKAADTAACVALQREAEALQPSVTFDSYEEAVVAWIAAGDNVFKYMRGSRKSLERLKLLYKYHALSQACYAEVIRLRPPSPPSFCKCYECHLGQCAGSVRH